MRVEFADDFGIGSEDGKDRCLWHPGLSTIGREQMP